MKHPQVLLLSKLYSDLKEGNYAAVLEACNENVTFQVPGKSALAGKYTKANVVDGLFEKQKKLSNGTFKLELHDLMTSDTALHATAVMTYQVTVAGKTTELRSVHVWRFENGKPLAWYEYPRDLYQFDAIFGG